LWKFDQYVFVTQDLHSFIGTFAHIWSNWNRDFVLFSQNHDFNWNLSMKYNSYCLFFTWLLSFRMSTLKSLIMMIGQCSKNCWIILWIFFGNVKIEHEWNLYTHTILFFCVLILKVVIIYYEPSLVIVLKEFKCMCMLYIIINPWPNHGLKCINNLMNL